MIRGALLSAALAAVPAATGPSHVSPQPDDGGIEFIEVECVVYQTRVNNPPLIDWKCAEDLAEGDGGDYYDKNFAIAILAVRDHRYEERAR
jgi:hypothetical protein